MFRTQGENRRFIGKKNSSVLMAIFDLKCEKFGAYELASMKVILLAFDPSQIVFFWTAIVYKQRKVSARMAKQRYGIGWQHQRMANLLACQARFY
jgi:hypothetical protein